MPLWPMSGMRRSVAVRGRVAELALGEVAEVVGGVQGGSGEHPFGEVAQGRTENLCTDLVKV